MCCACVVDMGLSFQAVLCSLHGSSVVGIIEGLWVVPGLFHGDVVGEALSLALFSVSRSGESWY